jgi:uncharacterized protein (TIGR02270 family)
MDRYEDIAEEHAGQAAFLWHLRSLAVAQSHYLLDDLEALDSRLAAHVDGLREASTAWDACRRLLADGTPWAAAPLALMALERGDGRQVAQLLALAEQQPAWVPMLEAAFGWVSPQFLRGTIRVILHAASPLWRRIGLAGCAIHRVDPGATLASALDDADPLLRARALRCAGELGRVDLLPACLRALADQDAECRYRAAAAALLLGDRGPSIDALSSLGSSFGPWQERALRRVLKVLDGSDARALLAPLAAQPEAARALMAGVGHTGDVRYAEWLIERMGDPATARPAGEVFTFITGADLAALGLDRPAPDAVEAGPGDDPADDRVAMDLDEGLPWPQQDAVAAWWRSQAGRFTSGVRHFLGQVASPQHCVAVLRRGYQRQRIAAAQHLCLAAPGGVAFPVDAPAWRQLQLLEPAMLRSGAASSHSKST